MPEEAGLVGQDERQEVYRESLSGSTSRKCTENAQNSSDCAIAATKTPDDNHAKQWRFALG